MITGAAITIGAAALIYAGFKLRKLFRELDELARDVEDDIDLR